MSEKMLMCDALDERDFLAKKISDSIRTFVPCFTKRKMDKKLATGEDVEEFSEKVKRDYQSIHDMIARREAINKAIIMSNATTKIKIKSTDAEISVAEAIAMRKSINSDDLTGKLLKVMERSFEAAINNYEVLARKKDQMDENYKNTLAGREGKILSAEEIESVEKLTDGYNAELIDPLKIKELIDTIENKQASIKKEIDTALKVSNATTYIEF
jgi:hypothetical protein